MIFLAAVCFTCHCYFFDHPLYCSIDFFIYFQSCSMTTPNGRFMTQKKICLSISDCKFFCLSNHNPICLMSWPYSDNLMFAVFAVHPESWNPMWSVSRSDWFKLWKSLYLLISGCIFNDCSTLKGGFILCTNNWYLRKNGWCWLLLYSFLLMLS